MRWDLTLSCTILHYLALYCTILHCLALSCSILHCLAPSCTILHYLAHKVYMKPADESWVIGIEISEFGNRNGNG